MMALRSRPLWQLVGLAAIILVFVGGAGAAGDTETPPSSPCCSRQLDASSFPTLASLYAQLEGRDPSEAVLIGFGD